MASGSNAPFSGDHSDLSNVDSGQHHTKVTPDDSTIVENSNGDLQSQSFVELVGDFEKSFGGWAKNKVSEFIKRKSFSDSQFSKLRGNFYIKMRTLDGEVSSISNSFDLSSVQKLVFSFNQGASRPNNSVIVEIDGTQEFSFVYGDTAFNWRTAEVDVSNYSGIREVSIKQDNNANFGVATAFDEIKLVRKPFIVNTQESGN